MNVFIKELKKDHEQLLEILLDAQSKGLGTDAGRNKLLESKQLLVGHLNKEDSKLYPEMKKLAKDNAYDMKIIDGFVNEMKSLTKDIVSFIGKVDNTDMSIEFAKELGKIISLVRMRIRKEEIQLYPLYERLLSK